MKADIIKDIDGKRTVIINDLHFRGRRKVDWKVVENYLKGYIGQCAEIMETADMVYIDKDFPDEFAHSKDTKTMRGANMYAKFGWYRYDTRFAIPVYDDLGKLIRYNPVFDS